MEEETITPGRGSPESAKWFRDELTSLGLSHRGLTRLMLELGDDRRPATIMRCIGRMASGNARVAGEMRAFLGILQRFRDSWAEASNDRTVSDTARTAR